jgi:Cytochrome bd terminal oxidase subunit I
MGFGVRVVTGIVLSFEFGLGFAKFAQLAGPAIGPMIALEVLTSFSLKRVSSGSCSLECTEWGPSCTFLLHAWWRLAHYCLLAAGMVMIAAGIAGLAIIVLPMVVPFRLSIWSASSSRLSQIFVLTARQDSGEGMGRICFTAPLMGLPTAALSRGCIRRESGF